jgi:hypothetical protein
VADEAAEQPLIDYAHHRLLFEQTREAMVSGRQPTRFTVRATVELLHDYLKEARVRNHRFRSDEAGPGGGDEAANPLGYFVAAVGF